MYPHYKDSAFTEKPIENNGRFGIYGMSAQGLEEYLSPDSYNYHYLSKFRDPKLMKEIEEEMRKERESKNPKNKIEEKKEEIQQQNINYPNQNINQIPMNYPNQNINQIPNQYPNQNINQIPNQYQNQNINQIPNQYQNQYQNYQNENPYEYQNKNPYQQQPKQQLYNQQQKKPNQNKYLVNKKPINNQVKRNIPVNNKLINNQKKFSVNSAMPKITNINDGRGNLKKYPSPHFN